MQPSWDYLKLENAGNQVLLLLVQQADTNSSFAPLLVLLFAKVTVSLVLILHYTCG